MSDGGTELVSQENLLQHTLAFELLFEGAVFQAYACYEVPQHCERWLNAVPRLFLDRNILPALKLRLALST